MKRILFILMILMIATPGLVCAMPQCSGEQADGVATALPSGAQHCTHEKHRRASQLPCDCAKTDLQKLDAWTLNGPATAGKILPAAIDDFRTEAIHPVRAVAIRGPPASWPTPSEMGHPLFLTTQRIRQ